MTLTTRAEREHAREVETVVEHVRDDLAPLGRAEEWVMEREGAEDDPAHIPDAKWQARQWCDDLRDEAEDSARCYTESDYLAADAAMHVSEDTYHWLVSEVEHAPTINCEVDA